MLEIQFRRSRKPNLKLKSSLKSRYQMVRRMKIQACKKKISNCTANKENAVKVIQEFEDYQEQDKRYNMASLLPKSNI